MFLVFPCCRGHASLPTSWSSVALPAPGVARGGGLLACRQSQELCAPGGCTAALGVLPQVHTPDALCLVGGWVDNEPLNKASQPERAGVGGIWNLGLALAPTHKILSGKTNVTELCFHSSCRSAEFWDSQHKFLSSSGSEYKANATCLSTLLPPAVKVSKEKWTLSAFTGEVHPS